MKKSFSLLLALVMCLSLFALTACSDKVESDEHFGYKLDYIEENFPYKSIKSESNLVSERPSDGLLLIQNNTDDLIFRFDSSTNDEDYCNVITIYGRKQEVKDNAKILNHEFDLIDIDDELIDSLESGEKIEIGSACISFSYSSMRECYYIYFWK